MRLYKLKPKARALVLGGIGIALGNRKISKGVGVWNLPAIETCPGKTKMCEAKCYARKAERHYPQVLPARHRNLRAAQEDFVGRMVKLICLSGVQWLRIHESGDFFSQEYLDKWIEISRSLPGVRFLAFTASHFLDFTDVPANLSILFSVWPDTLVLPAGRKAYAGTGEGWKCPKDCGPGECTFCWEQTEDVVFDLH